MSVGSLFINQTNEMKDVILAVVYFLAAWKFIELLAWLEDKVFGKKE